MPGKARAPRAACSLRLQAVAAIMRAWRGGVRRQCLELLPSISEDAGEREGWPGGIAQQFLAVRPLVEEIVKALKQLDELKASAAGVSGGLWSGKKASRCCSCK
jgi:hypothetical protein